MIWIVGEKLLIRVLHALLSFQLGWGPAFVSCLDVTEVGLYGMGQILDLIRRINVKLNWIYFLLILDFNSDVIPHQAHGSFPEAILSLHSLDLIQVDVLDVLCAM